VIADNTYGPLRFRPFDHGANVSINAGTKYISGHSDVMIGLIACDRGVYRRIKRQVLFCFTLVTGPRRSLSLKLSDTRVYEP